MKLVKIENISADVLSQNVWGDERTAILRQLREPLLKAWDIYKGNVAVGISPRDAEFDAAVAWYFNLLNLVEDAVWIVPECVKRHLR